MYFSVLFNAAKIEIYTSIIFIGFRLKTFAQANSTKFIGHYRNYSRNDITINLDSTFMYRWHFDLMSSWTKGTWRTNNDTLYFKAILVYDTLRYTNKKGKLIDSLVLSIDEKPELITSPDTSGALNLDGQNQHQYPAKLFHLKDKLFSITTKGKLIRKKYRVFGSDKKWPPWYIKQPEE